MSKFLKSVIAKESDLAPMSSDDFEAQPAVDPVEEAVGEIDAGYEEVGEAADELGEAQNTAELLDGGAALIESTSEQSPTFGAAVAAAESLQAISRLAQAKYGISVRNSGIESFNPKKLSGLAMKAVAREAEQTSDGIGAKIKAGIKKLIEMLKALYEKVVGFLTSVKSKIAKKMKEAASAGPSAVFITHSSINPEAKADMKNAYRAATNGTAEELKAAAAKVEESVKKNDTPVEMNSKEYNAMLKATSGLLEDTDALAETLKVMQKQVDAEEKAGTATPEKLAESQEKSRLIKEILTRIGKSSSDVAKAMVKNVSDKVQG